MIARPRSALRLLLGLLLLAACGATALRADDPPPSVVPDLALLSLPEAAQVLADSGLVLERYFEHKYSQGYELGRVIQQKPRPGALVKRGSGVLLMVSAAENGAAEGRAPDPAWPRPAPAAPPAAPAPAPEPGPVPAPAPALPTAPSVAPGVPPLLPTPRPPGARGGSDPEPVAIPLPPPMPVAPPLDVTPAAPPAPVEAPVPAPAPPTPAPPAVAPPAPAPPAVAPPATAPVGPAAPDVPLPPVGSTGTGSPDAPAVAERATPGKVPDLRGLALNDAEQRAREAEMQLYVERVPGHPIGRVVEQIPAPGEQRGKGAIVRVNVTAGGDYDGGVVVPAPAVDVPRVMVPDLLDRTPPQAERILSDLGLAMRFEEAKRGLPGRVVDQKPAAGSELPKGGLVTLWVMPANAGAPGNAPVGPPAPAAGAAPTLPVAPPRPEAPVPAPPVPAAPVPSAPVGPTPGASVAPTQAAVPAPIAPSEGTTLPKQRTLALGFSWLPVEGADAYVLEIEERGPSGWLPSVRKPARAAATTVELERIAPQASDVRWRVRAVLAGREGQPSAWVTLR